MTANETNYHNLIEWLDGCFSKTSKMIRLHERQKEAILKSLEAFLNQGRRRGIIQMPTGTGKTIVAAAIIMAFHRLRLLREKDIVLYLTPRVVLKGQVEDEFFKIFEKSSLFKTDFYGFTRNVFEIKHFKENITRDLDWVFNRRQSNEVLIGIVTPNGLHDFLKGYEDVNKLSNSERIRLILLDEIHRVYFGPQILESLNKILRLKEAVIIGLSATPIKQAIEYLGQPIYSLSSLQAMKEGILVRRLKIYSTETITRFLEENVEDEWKVAVIERAEKYSEEILRLLREEVKSIYQDLPDGVDPLAKRIPKTLVVSANTTEADEIAKKLRELIHDIRPKDNTNKLVRIAHYKVEESVNEIKRFKEQKEGILVTVNMADMGFDDPNLEALVIARRIKTPIAYVQIRGRVLRMPKDDSNNIKASKYAILIDLTGSAEHEESVESVELGEFEVKSVEVESDLKGQGEVKKVHGKVTIKPEYEIKIIEAPDVEKVKKEILRILRLPYGLATEFIMKELRERGFNITLTNAEDICRVLAKEGKLIRRDDTWFYTYEARIRDILVGGEKRYESLEEFMKEAEIPLIERQEVVRIINAIVEDIMDKHPEKHWKLSELCKVIKIRPHELMRLLDEKLLDRVLIEILVISRKGKMFASIKNLSKLIQSILDEEESWIVIRYPLRFKQEVKRQISNIKGLECFDVIEKEISKDMGDMLLKEKIVGVFIKVQEDVICPSSFEEIVDLLLRGYETVEIKIPLIVPLKECYERIIVKRIAKITPQLGYMRMYDLDEDSRIRIIRLRKRK